MTEQIDREQAQREALLRQAEVAAEAERQAAFDAEYGDALQQVYRYLVAYGVTKVSGYYGWGVTAAQEPKVDITGDSAILAWVAVRVHRHTPDVHHAVPVLPTWIDALYRLATGQPVTPAGDTATLTLTGQDQFEALVAVAVEADAHGATLNGMLPPELLPEPAVLPPTAGPLNTLRPA